MSKLKESTTNKTQDILDKFYGYGALLVLGAGTVYTGVHLAQDNQQVIAAGTVVLVLFAMRSILRLFK